MVSVSFSNPLMPQTTKSKFLQLFERDQGRCVYCGLDLKADYDRFMMATQDHLVPSSSSTGKNHNLDNLILSCVVCNRFKADFVPEPAIDVKNKRRDYIAAVRKHIMTRRSDKLKEFMRITHPELTDYH